MICDACECDELQIHGDRIEHRHEPQRADGREREPADLRVAERLPERSAVQSQGNSANTVAAAVISGFTPV
jgi:hypothetical protein